MVFLKKKNQVKPKTLHSFKEMNTAYIHKLKGYLKYTLILIFINLIFERTCDHIIQPSSYNHFFPFSWKQKKKEKENKSNLE